METATVEPGNDPMHEQNQREDPQRERRLLAARPHAFAQEVRIERRERNDHDDGEDCEIRPKARDGDRAGRSEQRGGRGDHEQACLEVSRDWHPLLYHFGGSEVVPSMTLNPPPHTLGAFHIASRIGPAYLASRRDLRVRFWTVTSGTARQHS